MMQIVWDGPKRLANLDKHGINFADIPLEFFESTLGGKARDGRYFALGILDVAIVVIYVVISTEGISIVSARPACRKERRAIE